MKKSEKWLRDHVRDHVETYKNAVEFVRRCHDAMLEAFRVKTAP